MKKQLLFIALVILSISSCKKDQDIVKSEEPAKNEEVSPNNVKGFVQKGPFSVGSTISVQELLPSLSPTGRVFESQVEDNRGTFQLSNIFLVSSFIALRADGFYFNEITGAQSASQITLNCISDISNKSIINVNLISHIEKPRIEYLISQGVSFVNAKKQAEQEVLKIFHITKTNIPESELLDITHNGDDNAILLAVSVMLQGYRTESELSELLASISYDLRPDGILTDSALGTALINDAKYLKLPSIRQNINTRWNLLGISDTVPNFEKYVNNFIDSTEYAFTNFISYPYSGLNGINILNTTDNAFSGAAVSIAALLPRGASLKIVGPLGIQQGTGNGWDYLGNTSQEMTLGSNKSGLILIYGCLSHTGSIKFYENGSTVPTRIKYVYLQ